MSLRIRSVLDLPQTIRDSVRTRLSEKPPVAQRDWKLAELRAERDKLVLALLEQLYAIGFGSLFVREYQFHPERRWRFDLYCAAHKLGVELHGGIYNRGRHLRPEGFIHDREKMNAAVALGIRVLEYWPQSINDGSALAQIEAVCR